MKNISLILNIVLIIAVSLLYIDKFTGNSEDEIDTESAAKPGEEVVYINLDSLMNSYDLYNELKTELMQEQQKLEGNLNSKLKGYQRRAMEFQQKVEKRLVTTKQAEQMQQQLMQEQQSLAQLKDQLQMQLMEKEQEMTKQIYDKLNNFLEKYNKTKKHKIILGNTMGNVVLKADDKLDITNTILNGLNEEYQNKETKEDEPTEEEQSENNEE
jgi:outer membrane protein